jgi:6-phosphofructokinase 1
MVDFLAAESINLLFCVGGDGTQRGAHALCEEIRRRELPISVIGVPKTIDNDIKFVWRTFGFFTALEKATEVIDSAHNEARGVENGIGLVKLMGRESGFIAAGATTASGQVNFALIPEVPFELEGEQGLLAKLERRLRARRHAVIVVAEGAGQDLLSDTPDAYDASGNRKLGDIGGFLRERIGAHFKKSDLHVSIKYLDPSYHIRSVAANCADSLLCDEFGRFAAHAGMAGKTDMLMGLWNNMFVHVPLKLATGAKKRVSPESDLWASVLSVTGQERW